MKYNEFKESLKKKATNLRDIKIGLKEAQRVLYFNSYGIDGEIHSRYLWEPEKVFTTEQLRRRKNAIDAYDRCTRSYWAAYHDYRERHIAISLFRGRTPEQIENNYYDGKWSYTVQCDIDKHLKQLQLDNPPKTYYHEFQDVV